MFDNIINKLDLSDYLNSFNEFLSREKPLFIEGDIAIHYKFIQELQNYDFTPPKKVANLDDDILYLKKMGVLKLERIYEFIKIINYFLYLKKFPFEGKLNEWFSNINIPLEILEVCNFFDEKGNLRVGIDEKLDSINSAISKNREISKGKVIKLLSLAKLQSYLVDRQIHLVNDEETLLLRAGYNHIIKGQIVSRSSSGFFYVLPEEIVSLKSKLQDLIADREEIIYKIAQKISALFLRFIKFLSFINREFDRFDSYQARLFFAKAKNLEFILPSKNSQFILKDFAHPALKNPKKITVDFSKSLILITGVNAGGKTMLLKSALSAGFLAKYLIPLTIHSESKIPHFKDFVPILEDPQNVKNDISTFAGRMVEFSKLFGKKELFIGVDEIELGTDSDEASALFKVILEYLIKNQNRVIITTHHKKLASLMAGHSDVELFAAMYDEAKEMPTFEFLKGTIGKSYAFETAKRYGIAPNLIIKAKEVYGEDKERLNELIQKSSELEFELKSKRDELNRELESVKNLKESLKSEKETIYLELKKRKAELDRAYQDAIYEVKKGLKSSPQEAHKSLNTAHNIIKDIVVEKPTVEEVKFEVGNSIKYRDKRGVINSIKGSEAIIDIDGFKFRVPLVELKKVGQAFSKPAKLNITYQRPSNASLTLDLHGLRSEEALDKLDKFLSTSLLAGFDEVLVYTGIGTGRLSAVVKEFLEAHPSVKSFSDAPLNMGGFGAKVIKL